MSKTSFFSKAVFKRNLKGYWPLWTAYLISFIVMIPVPIYNTLHYGYKRTADGIVQSYFDTALTTSLVIGAFFAIFATMAVFSYMYTARAANMTASFPVKRSTIFTTNLITVVSVTVFVHVVTAFITILTIALYDISLLYIIPIFQWCIIGILMTLFFIGLSFFCATLTGNILILPCIYGVLNFSVILINTILTTIFSEFLYGYTSQNVPELVLWLTPAAKLINITTRLFKVAEDATYVVFGYTGTILIYALAGLIFFGIAFLIHKNRHTETASDIIAVKPVKPIVKYFFAAIGSLTLGIILNEMFFPSVQENFVGYIITMIIGGFIGYFASEMLVFKSFKVWHKWKGFAVYSVAVIAFVLCLAFDVTNFETSVPRADDVETATVEVYGEILSGDSSAVVDIAINLHEYIIDHKDADIDYDTHFANVDITYTLYTGAEIRRSYYCNIPEFLVDAYDSPENCYERIKLSDRAQITQAYIEYNDGTGWQHLPITEDQCYELYNCMLSDLGHSSLGKVTFGINALSDTAVTLGVDYKTSSYSDYWYYYENIPLDAANCMAYLKTLGIILE